MRWQKCLKGSVPLGESQFVQGWDKWMKTTVLTLKNCGSSHSYTVNENHTSLYHNCCSLPIPYLLSPQLYYFYYYKSRLVSCSIIKATKQAFGWGEQRVPMELVPPPPHLCLFTTCPRDRTQSQSWDPVRTNATWNIFVIFVVVHIVF